jgi:hypothetical protein
MTQQQTKINLVKSKIAGEIVKVAQKHPNPKNTPELFS